MSDKCPKCFSEIEEWSNDPILTPLGLAGEDYKGFTFIKSIHIRELREYYNTLEIDLGVVPTVWTDNLTDTTNKFICKHIYIEELREAIETLLLTAGKNLEEYFKYDKYAEPTGLSQTEWTDVDRDNIGMLPLLPTKSIIRAIHIEELRIGIFTDVVFWLEDWKVTDNWSDSGSRNLQNPFTEEFQNSWTGDKQGEEGWATFFNSEVDFNGTVTWSSQMDNHIYKMAVAAHQGFFPDIAITTMGGLFGGYNLYNPTIYVKETGILLVNDLKLDLVSSESLISSVTPDPSFPTNIAASSIISMLITVEFYNAGDTVTCRTIELYNENLEYTTGHVDLWEGFWEDELNYSEKLSHYTRIHEQIDFNNPTINLTNLIQSNFGSLLINKDFCRIDTLRIGICARASAVYCESGQSNASSSLTVDSIKFYH